MRVYGKSPLIIMLILSLTLLGGCSGMFGTSESSEPYFYGDFEDIPIPGELSVKETTIFTTPGGIKSGLQVYKGRVEVGSLNSAMAGYMQRDGWTLRSATRGTRSLMLFEKDDRYATIYIIDGMFNTEMQVYVSPKITMFGQAGARTQEIRAGAAQSASAPSSSFDSQYLTN